MISPSCVEHADRVLLVAEVETDGDGWNFGFHGSWDCITALKRRPAAFSSNLVRFLLPGWPLERGIASRPTRKTV